METVITLTSAVKGSKPQMGKVYKPTAEVTADDVKGVVAKFGRGESAGACCS